ncbi:MDR family MFS transporter [Edwardsiella anguillarum]|uniref:MDR family MFS transporter n=1 Tax=Edwardsiella anguillarum TaxID=1821960 RepID=UPI0024B80917|nr:MDR family MFS transporter [Edwardsiella anguillarum]WHP81926.1 MFS transporter [Edwardsiella anguillarum]WHQ19428.1 MFS transporter [Edwardsiella anguillarum]WHQ22974.1 MFS transporter [Edwardsiella anguillarum]WHQ26498.1 MFS transporter [Edwardsiella anguillarum]WHQ30011.1 MFS transporter [Edwardsiella anguillarum]
MSTDTTSISPKRVLVLAACMLATFMAAIEVTIVSTAMPTIIADLGGFSLLGWVFAAYLLTQAISIPIYGRLADLHGRKRMFYIGASLFLLGSVLCGFAHSMLWLIAFRALQGAGAGAITPIAVTIIADVYGPLERPRIQGYLSSVWGVSAIVGPLMGAFIVQHFHWSLVFWINLPIGCCAMYLLWRYFPEQRHPRRHALDLAGTAWLAIGISALLLSLLQAEWLGWWVLLLLAIAVLSGFLLWHQELRAAEPLFPAVLWRQRIMVAGNIGGLVVGAAMMGVAAFLPTYVQGVMGYSALEAGTTLALMSIGWPIASTLSGRLMAHTSYRTTALLGALLLIAGSLCLLWQTPQGSLWWGRVSAFIIGAAMGMTNTTFLVSVQNSAPHSMRGIATACTVFTRMLGSALGTAVLGATLNLNLAWRLPQVSDPVQRLMTLRTQPAAEEVGALLAPVAASLHAVFIAAALLAWLALLAAWLIPAGAGLRERIEEIGDNK